jgi:hypothetical protein
MYGVVHTSFRLTHKRAQPRYNPQPTPTTTDSTVSSATNYENADYYRDNVSSDMQGL